ncbi:hypothetical protein Rhopal_003991-T1 [Rhodotorula paludigena]|uniref:Uncharacterized protein n=1 Tax=Rhodotorula paludigena TaxID=86838 RepID=A0AAV5GNA6_9BASI|nr:hypothetical protein Rhopal_003991-T1 [Rhodotorula paludigena]
MQTSPNPLAPPLAPDAAAPSTSTAQPPPRPWSAPATPSKRLAHTTATPASNSGPASKGRRRASSVGATTSLKSGNRGATAAGAAPDLSMDRISGEEKVQDSKQVQEAGASPPPAWLTHSTDPLTSPCRLDDGMRTALGLDDDQTPVAGSSRRGSPSAAKGTAGSPKALLHSQPGISTADDSLETHAHPLDSAKQPQGSVSPAQGEPDESMPAAACNKTSDIDTPVTHESACDPPQGPENDAVGHMVGTRDVSQPPTAGGPCLGPTTNDKPQGRAGAEEQAREECEPDAEVPEGGQALGGNDAAGEANKGSGSSGEMGTEAAKESGDGDASGSDKAVKKSKQAADKAPLGVGSGSSGPTNVEMGDLGAQEGVESLEHDSSHKYDEGSGKPAPRDKGKGQASRRLAVLPRERRVKSTDEQPFVLKIATGGICRKSVAAAASAPCLEGKQTMSSLSLLSLSNTLSSSDNGDNLRTGSGSTSAAKSGAPRRKAPTPRALPAPPCRCARVKSSSSSGESDGSQVGSAPSSRASKSCPRKRAKRGNCVALRPRGKGASAPAVLAADREAPVGKPFIRGEASRAARSP